MRFQRVKESKSQSNKKGIEQSRKRRKFQSVKKYIIGVVISSLVVVISFFAWYFLIYRNRPLYLSPLPIAQVLQQYIRGDGDDREEKELTQALKKNKIEYTSIDTSQSTAYSITLKDGGEVVLATDKNIVEQIASLQVILNRLTMEGRQFKRLDLRFSKPVITF